MARATELPQLISEFVDMSKEYLRQETIEPAKQLGRFAGLSLAAAVLFSIGSLFLSVAGVRFIISVLPEGPYWEGLGYVVGAIAIVAVVAVVVAVAGRESRKD